MTKALRDGVLAGFPGAFDGAGTERIGAGAAEGVPVGDGKAEVLGERFAVDDLIGLGAGENVAPVGDQRGIGRAVLNPGHFLHAEVGAEGGQAGTGRRSQKDKGSQQRRA